MKSSERLIGYLTELIAFDTTNPPGNEAAVVAYLKQLFPECQNQVISHGENRSSLIIHLTEEVADRPSISFIGHIDTVPFTSENWSYPPLAATIESDRLYGRGASDMKSGLACMIELGQFIRQHPQQVTSNVRLVFTADEESGGLGMKDILEQNLIKDHELLVVPEPTDLSVAYQEKGALWLKLEIVGKASHGSMPQAGRNAIQAVFDFQQALLKRIAAGNDMVGPTTVSLNKISGGNKVNVVADYAVAELDIRYPPEIDWAHLEQAIRDCQSELSGDGIDITYQVLNHRPALINQQPGLRGVVRQILADLKLDYREIGVKYYTDLSSFKQLSNEFVIFGPGISQQAHVEDEYVEIPSLHQAYRFYQSLVTKEWPHEER